MQTLVRKKIKYSVLIKMFEDISNIRFYHFVGKEHRETFVDQLDLNKEYLFEISVRHNENEDPKEIIHFTKLKVSKDYDNLLSIYDLGEDCGGQDRITIVFNEYNSLLNGKKVYDAISASLMGSGVYTWVFNIQKGRHLGKKILFNDLTKELQNKLIDTITN